MSSASDPKVFVIEKKCGPDERGMRVTNFDKWLIAGIIAIIFFVLALPFIFRLTNKATRFVGVRTVYDNGVPSLTGMLLHTIIFLILVRLLMH